MLLVVIHLSNIDEESVSDLNRDNELNLLFDDIRIYNDINVDYIHRMREEHVLVIDNYKFVRAFH
jgi:hypothetical protein